MKPIGDILLLALLFSVFYSCEKEAEEDPYDGRIKRVKYYQSVDDTIVRNIEEYQYDSKNRLEAIESGGGIVKFEYNHDNQLVAKYYIYEDPGFNDTITYLYKDGKLVSELQNSNLANSMNFQNLKTVYEYENAILVKRKKYRDDIFQELTVYEYKDDLMKKETIYYDSLELHLQVIKSHYYDEHEKLSFTTCMYENSQGMAWFLSIYYLYNEHGDLDMEYSEQSYNSTAPLTYCKRYEY